jgi:DNA-binding response OmpR family regulator
VVEDEVLLADAIGVGLRREALAVDVAHDGLSAYELLGINQYDVVVLDRDLPGIHGDELCRMLVSTGDGPRVLMLTAAGEVHERVAGLSLGADDYLPKPFDFTELVARVRAMGRRAPRVTPPRLARAGVELDPARRQAFRDGAYLPLSLKEFAVLEELLRADGAVLSSEHLLERVWDENTDPFTNVVRVTVHTLRRKLGEPPLIRTLRGAGYQVP